MQINFKKRNIIFILFLTSFFVKSIHAQPGYWTWVNGDTTAMLPAVFGVQGVPDSLNHPLGGYEGCEWTDNQGNFWFFESRTITGAANDLWKYSPVNNMWTFIKGSMATNDTGNYGVQGVSAGTNLPPARGFGIATWTDTAGGLWMYGGGNSSPSTTFNDLWKFDIGLNNWVWVNGSNVPNQPPVYGTKGVSSSANSPGARSEAVCTWVDDSNNLWLFGGASANGTTNNSLWKYSIVDNEWTWMKGADSTDSPGVFGIKGVEDSLSTPSGRYAYSRWKDDNGNFWLFGGKRYWSGGYYLNDLWKYNITTNNWTWVKGPENLPLDTGLVGSECDADTSFNPMSRFENRSCWKDNSGNFWMFGGTAVNVPSFPYSIYLNDLWMYNSSMNEWTLIWQDSLYNLKANFGIKGIASPCNKPLGAMGSVSWYDKSANAMYLFGGLQYDHPGSGNFRSEMWKYELDTTCNVNLCIITGTEQQLSKVEVSIYPNPTTGIVNFSNIENIDRIDVYDLTGRSVFHSAEINKSMVNLSGLPAGIFYIFLYSNDALVFKSKLLLTK